MNPLVGSFLWGILIGSGILTASYAAFVPNISSADHQLSMLIKLHDQRALITRDNQIDDKYILGRALFFDPVLSGNRDIACATCHLLDFGTSDGLKASRGSLAIGLGPERVYPENVEFVVQSLNAPDLYNRDHNDVTSLFWGASLKVSKDVNDTSVFTSNAVLSLPDGLENLLAAQSIHPLMRVDEMLGLEGSSSPGFLPSEHRGMENELSVQVGTANNPVKALEEGLLLRLLGSDDDIQLWQGVFRELFSAAYPSDPIESIGLSHIANAISRFEEVAFATLPSRWDIYLNGNSQALSDAEKHGAILFFGKGMCGTCHSGTLFSNFETFNIGVPSPGASDFNRYRIPPLRNVTKSAPYFHNGYSPTLIGAITHHVQPSILGLTYDENGSFQLSADEVNSIETEYLPIDLLNNGEIQLIAEFLHSLESETKFGPNVIVPTSVPSSLRVGGY